MHGISISQSQTVARLHVSCLLECKRLACCTHAAAWTFTAHQADSYVFVVYNAQGYAQKSYGTWLRNSAVGLEEN